MSTVALSMIVKDEFDSVMRIIEHAQQYFDQMNIVVSDKPTYNKLKKNCLPFTNLTFKYREWNDQFDAARNVSMQMCTTDYMFWLDADDYFDFRAIPQLVIIADESHIDAIFLPYNYAQDDEGNCITKHWRERLIRLDKNFEWRGWVHETCITDDPYVSHLVNQEVKHNNSPQHAKLSGARNHTILEKAFAETQDPRYLFYLGMSHYSLEHYDESIKLLNDYLKVGGSAEDIYRALTLISEAAYFNNAHTTASDFAAQASILKPEYPMAYWLLAQYEADQSNWKEALEWIRVSETKPDPETLSVWDPSARERAALIGAQAEFMLGNFNAALEWLRKIPNNKTGQSLLDDFTKEADAETFLKLLPRFTKYFETPKTMWNALTHDIKYDLRIQTLRYAVTEPKKWGDNSIVIFCGQGFEEWGPHTQDKGMGGSEEAVLYLSRELAKLGWNVTVFGEADITEVGISYRVVWKPWKQIDMRDTFNVFVSWRAPQYLEKVTAKVKLCDIHDVLDKSLVKNIPDVTYLVKTQYHRNLYPELPDDKFVIIGNGIKKEQFND